MWSDERPGYRVRLKDEPAPCSHVWIDVADPKRTHVAPIIGSHPQMMQRGHSYACTLCGAKFVAPRA